MKININNKTNLPFEIIGKKYDNYVNKNKDRMITIFDGMQEFELFGYKKRDYKMTIEYKLTCISITVEELNIIAKKVSMKDTKLPKIPKKY